MIFILVHVLENLVHGVIIICRFDNNLPMSMHVTKICNAAFYHLHNIRRINKYLSCDLLFTLIHAFITSPLDYCNGLLYGLPKLQMVKLQHVQNAVATVILNLTK